MKNLFAGIGILLVLIYAIGSGLWVNTGDNWYRNLNAPSWQPPDAVFGLIWPYNFIMLGISSVIIANRLNTTLTSIYLGLFLVSVVTALTWAYQFYRPHNLLAASIALALTALFTVPMIVLSLQASIPIGVALVPYQLWLITATFLSFSYYRLN